jgi:hypothetical protein
MMAEPSAVSAGLRPSALAVGEDAVDILDLHDPRDRS